MALAQTALNRFGRLKRGVYGTYHQVRKKALGAVRGRIYFRLNEGNVKRHTLMTRQSH